MNEKRKNRNNVGEKNLSWWLGLIVSKPCPPARRPLKISNMYMQFLQFWMLFILLKFIYFFQYHYSMLISSVIPATLIFNFKEVKSQLAATLVALLNLVVDLFAITAATATATQGCYFSCWKKNLNLIAAFNYCCFHLMIIYS